MWLIVTGESQTWGKHELLVLQTAAPQSQCMRLCKQHCMHENPAVMTVDVLMNAGTADACQELF